MNKILWPKEDIICPFLRKILYSCSLLCKNITHLPCVKFITVEDFIKLWPKVLSLYKSLAEVWLRHILWPRIWVILLSIPCAVQKRHIILLLGRASYIKVFIKLRNVLAVISSDVFLDSLLLSIRNLNTWDCLKFSYSLLMLFIYFFSLYFLFCIVPATITLNSLIFFFFCDV